MTSAEYVSRTKAAISVLDPVETAVYLAFVAVACGVRVALYMCAGFGIAAVNGWSSWFAPLIAIGISQTIGRVYEYARRRSRVEGLEQLATGRVKP